jgi:sulfoxide reductase heme-binding subunit YedZ
MVSSTQVIDPSQHVYWLASRATGVIALVLVALSVGLGLALSGRLSRRAGVPAYLKTMHEATALTALVAIAAHGLLLLGDAYLRPGLAGILLPFQMSSQPVWTGVGILGGWLAVILGISFYFRRSITVQVWRWLHRWTLAVYLLAVAHTLGSGTDAGAPWLLVIIAATATPIVFMATFRFLPDGRRDQRRARGRAPARPGQPA